MQAPSELDKAVEYTKQFIDAVTPIAKHAYEIGLLTLRIDALQSLFIAAIGLVACLLVSRYVRKEYMRAKATAQLPENRTEWHRRHVSDHLFMDGLPHFVGGIMACLWGTISVAALINLWLWVKLFAPQLWLAHQAIEKLVK